MFFGAKDGPLKAFCQKKKVKGRNTTGLRGAFKRTQGEEVCERKRRDGLKE